MTFAPLTSLNNESELIEFYPLFAMFFLVRLFLRKKCCWFVTEITCQVPFSSKNQSLPKIRNSPMFQRKKSKEYNAPFEKSNKTNYSYTLSDFKPHNIKNNSVLLKNRPLITLIFANHF
jgi:hypothetical protein